MTAEFQGTARYRVSRRLGAGGMGVVYEATDLERGGQRIALKLLKLQDPASLMRLKREFRALVDVTHTNLVQLYELVVEHETWFFTLEHVDGVDFLEHVRPGVAAPAQRDLPTAPVDQTLRTPAGAARGAVDVDKLRPALAQLVSGVAALHAAGRLHRDLKPSNVLVTPQGHVKILDFGLVAELAGHDAAADTQGHELVGTAAYMAPEQAGAAAVGPAADWYAVGVVLFQALTGTLPFDGASMQVLIDKQRQPAPPVKDRAPHAPDDLARLADALLARAPEARPDAAAVLAAVGVAPALRAAPDTTFVGRAEHLETLRRELARARAGEPRVVQITGSSGIGKSALARRFLDEASDAGVLVLAGRCYERESVPYKALDSAIDVLARRLIGMEPSRVDAVLPRDASVLARMFPVLGRVPAFANAPQREVREAVEQRRRAVAALRELLARMTDRSPVIAFIDDVQWGDDDSAQVLAELLTPPDAPSVLWVLSARELGPAARGMPGKPTFIELEALPAHEARVLAEAALGSAAPEAVDRLAKESGGNPFLLQQLAAHPQGSDEGLDGVVRARVGGLDAPARALLEIVAVAGHPVDERVAVRAAQLQPAEWGCALTLKAAHLMKGSPGELAERFEAWHDRIRETLVASLPAARQAELHARLADALQELQPEALDAVAMHLHAAGQTERAAVAMIAAAGSAADKLAFDRAAQLYLDALEQLPNGDVRRRAVATRAADSLAASGRGAVAARVYQRALNEPGERAVTAGEELELNRRAGEQLLRSGHVDEGLAAIDEVCRAAGMTLAKSPWRAAGAWLFRRAHLALRGLDFKERAASEVPAAKLQQIDVCSSVSIGLSMVDTIRAASFQTRQLLLALEAGEPYRVARALGLEAAFVATGGRSREARVSQLLGEARKLAERVGDGRLHGTIDLCAAVAQFLVGRWRESLGSSGQAEQWFKELGNAVTWEAANARLFSVWSLFYMGEIAELMRRVPALKREAEHRGDLYAATSLELGLSNVATVAAGEPGRARDDVRAAMARWGRSSFHFQHYWAVLSEGMIDLYEGKPRDAFDRIGEAWPAMKRAYLLRTQNVRIEAEFLRARSAVACGEHEAAITGAEALEAEGVPWADAFAAATRGLVAAGRKSPDAAVTLLQEAILGFEAADMRLFAAATRLRLGEIASGSLAVASTRAGDAWMLAQGIKSPAALAQMLMPAPG
ncbi:MAG: AAA family ATPase [Myxococcaceae bacterium]|nr:AAA family ATPase [Myxococcaceae bacterium]